MSQNKINILITLLVVLLFFVVLSERIIQLNGPGVESIVFRPFNGGVNLSRTFGEGVYFVWPWNTVYKFNVREHSVKETLDIMVNNGVTVSVKVGYRFYPDRDSLPVIFRKYGPDYAVKFVHPEVLYAVREQLSSMSPENIYSLKLPFVERSALSIAAKRLMAGNVRISDLLILDIKLPKKVVDAIENKLREEQLVQEYEFKRQIALKEKEIKVIEASAIKMSEDTINKGLTLPFLQFKQIEAMQKLSVSPNAKTIVMPQGTRNPVILTGQ